MVSNGMPSHGDIQAQLTHRPNCAVEGANYRPSLLLPPQIKCLMKERNRLHRNLALNRTAWLQKCKEVAGKVEEAKRMSWRKHLKKIKVKKDARLAWRTVRGLKNNEQQPTGKALQYRGRLYHRDQAKANAFMQEYSSVSSRTSDQVSRPAVKQHRQKMQFLARCPKGHQKQAFHQNEL